MIWIALALAMTAAQDGPVAYEEASPTSLELYAGPPVRPYEPSWDTPAAEGDAYMVTRRALEAPAVLEAYDGTYEVTPSDAEVIYQQGVTSAALRANALMGPLDGRWRVTSPDGAPVLELLMMDRGDGSLVEGAWREPSAPGAALTSRRLGALSLVVRSGETLTIDVDDPDGPARLSLQRDGAGWRGTLQRGGAETAVIMTPQA
ncbi:MAG: hypothetical protein V7678_06650 [Brevundimonas sp.]